jgi:3-hydroxybutyryl-CoA dehydratase
MRDMDFASHPALDLPPVGLTVTQERIDRYADLSGDHNPLHVNPDFGRGTEFGSTIAHGPVCAALFFDIVGSYLGQAWPEGVEIEAVFLAPVRSGDQVQASGSVRRQADATSVTIELTCVKNGTDAAIRGTALVHG